MSKCENCGQDLTAYTPNPCNKCYDAPGREPPASPACSTRRFPMQHGPDIDWKTAEKIYVMYSFLHGPRQSLERLAERGGFGWHEVEIIQSNYDERIAR